MNANKTSERKKILIDITFLFDQYSRRGIGRTGREIVKRLIPIIIDNKDFELHLVGFCNLELNLVQLEFTQLEINRLINEIEFYSFGDPKPSGILNILRWGGWYKKALEDIKPDIFYALHFERGLPTAPIFAGRISNSPKTAVFYPDAIPIAIPDFKFSKKGFIQNVVKKWFYKKLIKGVELADLVLTCSNFSKLDIEKYVGTPGEKVKSIYLGIDDTFYKKNFDFDQGESRTVLGQYQVQDKKYFFYDSGLEDNKNTDELLEVFAKLQNGSRIPDFLVITGGDFGRGIGKSILPKSPQVKTIFVKSSGTKYFRKYNHYGQNF